MVRDILSPLFDNGVAPLMHLTYHAFGNVKNGSDGAFVYQHGPSAFAACIACRSSLLAGCVSPPAVAAYRGWQCAAALPSLIRPSLQPECTALYCTALYRR